MTSIHIPSSVTTIGLNAFAGCYSLQSVNITDIAAWCNIQFEHKSDLNASNPFYNIGCALYLNGEEIKELSIPNTVTSISAIAFQGCRGITSVDIPSSVTTIGDGAFANTGLTSVTIPSQIISYKKAFAASFLTFAKISDGITMIDEGAFNSCRNLVSIDIPASVTSIEFAAFAYCSALPSITLPASITNIGEGAFYQCSALTSVISHIQEPFAFGNVTFTDISDACVLYVPKGTKEAYIAAGWTEEVFKGGIVELEPSLEPLEEDETVDIADEITEETNIDGNVIGNIFYNINPENGGYADGCIVVSKPTEEASVEMEEGTDIFGEDFKAGFTGIVFKVPAGSGTIKITAETTGNTTLKVKIGNNAPIEMELEGKLKASFPYNVSKDTYVYIYAGQTSADGKRHAPGLNELKIYNVELKRDATPTAIGEVEGTKDNVQGDGAIYNMGGQRLSAPQKGLNIIRTEDGKTCKVFIK